MRLFRAEEEDCSTGDGRTSMLVGWYQAILFLQSRHHFASSASDWPVSKLRADVVSSG